MISPIEVNLLVTTSSKTIYEFITSELNKRISLVALSALAVAIVVIGALKIALKHAYTDVNNHDNARIQKAIDDFGNPQEDSKELRLSNLIGRTLSEKMISQIPEGVTNIKITGCPNLTDVSKLKVEKLDITGCNNLQKINSETIQELHINDSRISYFEAPLLKYVWFSLSDKSAVLPDLRQCPKLEYLSFDFQELPKEEFSPCLTSLNKCLQSVPLINRSSDDSPLSIRFYSNDLDFLDYIDELPKGCCFCFEDLPFQDKQNPPTCLTKLGANQKVSIKGVQHKEAWEKVLQQATQKGLKLEFRS